jgi:iron only hydrogenase large subunit-like protein
VPEYFHSVRLDEEKCKGCTNCIRFCPTEAIRVRKGKAGIITDRCIDCGVCVRICPHHAKQAVSDPLSMISGFDYPVAIPAPSLYGQFPENIGINRILTALKRLGFREVIEAAQAAELLSVATTELLKRPGTPRPLISSSCPAVVRLIQIRFPSLIDNIARLLSPMEVAARMARKRAPEGANVGVFFISPCAAKVTAIRSPLGHELSSVDGVIAIKDVYLPLLAEIGKIDREEQLSGAGWRGIGWACVEGEGNAVGSGTRISVDGVDHVIDVLDAVENGKLKDVDFIEAMACPGGCIGGPLAVENPYVAKTRVRARGRADSREMSADTLREKFNVDLSWTSDVFSKPAFMLDSDYLKAMIMMEELETINESLPGLDCGSCGAPTCRALAEDIVRGNASLTDCTFKLRENIRKLTEEMMKLEDIKPPGLDK